MRDLWNILEEAIVKKPRTTEYKGVQRFILPNYPNTKIDPDELKDGDYFAIEWINARKQRAYGIFKEAYRFSSYSAAVGLCYVSVNASGKEQYLAKDYRQCSLGIYTKGNTVLPVTQQEKEHLDRMLKKQKV